MMTYDFDRVIDRRGTNAVKCDGTPEGVLPYWIADMEFATVPEVTDALIERAKHPIYGYTDEGEEYFEALRQWFDTRFGWKVEKDWMILTPGVVPAIFAAVRALTEEGDAVLIQQPVYFPFPNAITTNGRRMVDSPLVFADGKYRIDFDDFERKIVENDVKLFIMCSPHNPVGRVWTVEELERVGEICLRHGVKVVSDEIHMDFVYPGHKHTVFASLRPEFADISVICTAPSKTFNLAGLQDSNIFVPNPELRERMKAVMGQLSMGGVNLMGLAACQAAYAHGAEWVRQLNAYLYDTVCFMREFIETRIPKVRMIEPEGTYLMWLDFRALGLDEKGLEELTLRRARVQFNPGAMFGPGGEGFERWNIACPRAMVEEGLLRLEEAINAL